MSIPWLQFKRVNWEEDAGALFSKRGQISGLAFGFEDDDGGTNIGQFWVDDLSLLGVSETVSTPPSGTESTGEDLSGSHEDEPSKTPIPCSGSIVIPIGIVLTSIWLRWVDKYEE